MSFINSGAGGSAVGDAIGNYMTDTADYGAVGNALNNFMDNGTDYSSVSNAINNYVGGDGLSNFGSESIYGNGGINIGGVNGGLLNTLGRLGTGLLGGLSDYQTSSNQQAYIPYTQWLGNGLARFSAINNTANKQQQKNDAYGNTLMLSSLFGPGKSLLGSFGGQIGSNYNE